MSTSIFTGARVTCDGYASGTKTTLGAVTGVTGVDTDPVTGRVPIETTAAVDPGWAQPRCFPSRWTPPSRRPAGSSSPPITASTAPSSASAPPTTTSWADQRPGHRSPVRITVAALADTGRTGNGPVPFHTACGSPVGVIRDRGQARNLRATSGSASASRSTCSVSVNCAGVTRTQSPWATPPRRTVKMPCSSSRYRAMASLSA